MPASQQHQQDQFGRDADLLAAEQAPAGQQGCQPGATPEYALER
jgi:hypothetical protein